MTNFQNRSASILKKKIADLMDHGTTPEEAERTARRDVNRALQGRELTLC